MPLILRGKFVPEIIGFSVKESNGQTDKIMYTVDFKRTNRSLQTKSAL